MIYVLCGVPGSGKSWVAKQLEDKFTYVSHDAHPSLQVLARTVYNKAHSSKKPVLVDCPFNEKNLLNKLKGLSLSVKPIFIIEHPSTVARQYQEREGRPPSQNVLTRANTIINTVKELNALAGTSKDILMYLQAISAS